MPAKYVTHTKEGRGRGKRGVLVVDVEVKVVDVEVNGEGPGHEGGPKQDTSCACHATLTHAAPDVQAKLLAYSRGAMHAETSAGIPLLQTLGTTRESAHAVADIDTCPTHAKYW